MYLIFQKIYRNLGNNVLDRSSISELLISLIESSNDDDLREECLKIINKLGIKNQKIFNLLENLLISDYNESIRKAAFRVIRNNYSMKGIKPVKFAIKKEESSFLILLIEFLAERDPLACKECIIDRLESFNDPNLNSFINEIKLENLDVEELVNIFFNYVLEKSLESLYFHSRKIPHAFLG